VKLPFVRNARLSGGWNVELQTPIVLGGRTNVECISPMWHLAGTDNGVIIDEAFSNDGCDWCFVEVKRTVDLLGRVSGIMA
jgi:hypothetical protein